MLRAAEGKWQTPSPKNGNGLFNNETLRVSHKQYKATRKHYYTFLLPLSYIVFENTCNESCKLSTVNGKLRGASRK